MCEEIMRDMWSCVFRFVTFRIIMEFWDFCLEASFWKIIEIFRGLSVGTLESLLSFNGYMTQDAAIWESLTVYTDIGLFMAIL